MYAPGRQSASLAIAARETSSNTCDPIMAHCSAFDRAELDSTHQRLLQEDEEHNWDELDLPASAFVSRRRKTSVSRVAQLWPARLTAIAALPRTRDTIFLTRQGRSYSVYSVGDKFEKYRDAAAVDKTVTFSWIRDAAYGAALSVSHAQAELLAGHRLPGTADNYLRRNPQLVADAWAAIAKAFEVPKQVAKLTKDAHRTSPSAPIRP